MRWWRQAPPFYSELHDDIARQPRANCGADCLWDWLSGGGRHHARRDECARAEHCGNAMVFGGHRRVMRLRAVQNALAATIIILCANILLREAAQRINQLPISAEGEKRYILKVTCNKEDESAVRQWLLNIVKEAAICLQGLGSVPAQEQGYKEIRAELVGHADYRKTRELIISRIGDNDNITAIHWSIDSQ